MYRTVIFNIIFVLNCLDRFCYKNGDAPEATSGSADAEYSTSECQAEDAPC